MKEIDLEKQAQDYSRSSYARPPKQSEDEADYVQAVAYYSFIAGYKAKESEIQQQPDINPFDFEKLDKDIKNLFPTQSQVEGKELFEWVKASEGDNVEIRGINFCKNCGSIIHSSCEYCDDSCKMAKDHRSVELFTFVKASDELPEKMGKYWIRYRNYAGIQLTGSFFDGFKFPHHQGTIEWLKPVKLNQPTR